MLTALALAGAALLAALVAMALLSGHTRRTRRTRRARPDSLSRSFDFDRYKRYEHK